MKAISLWQPYASLLVTPASNLGCTPREIREVGGQVPMVKRFETRSYPCPPSIIGQRIAFHAAKKRPKDVWQSSGEDVDFPATLAPFYDYGRYVDPQESNDGEWWRYRWDGPLGAIVGSGVITRSLPIVEDTLFRPPPMVYVDKFGRLVEWRSSAGSTECPPFGEAHHGGEWFDISDQLPYGDFTPGRWAWELSDVVATSDQCPWCAGFGNVVDRDDPTHDCPVCHGVGWCEPIPAVGRQGFWNWQPIP